MNVKIVLMITFKCYIQGILKSMIEMKPISDRYIMSACIHLKIK